MAQPREGCLKEETFPLLHSSRFRPLLGDDQEAIESFGPERSYTRAVEELKGFVEMLYENAKIIEGKLFGVSPSSARLVELYDRLSDLR
jgi:hypothetical protein